ncbi:MAG: hypothetical protein PWP04_1675 [Candidatus Atribacteria bacterium]|nr:hypothetical protein [Candidatus Atribacteria bacterium]
MTKVSFRKMAYAALFCALAVVSSGVSFPVGPTKVFPFQHAINVVAGIMIGPWYGGLAAFLAGLLRIAIGTGTIFALPGGVPGVIMVGLFFGWLRRDWVALTEPLGTGLIGAGLSAYLVSPFVGGEVTFFFFQSAFLVSSIPGCIIGLLFVRVLRRAIPADIWEKMGGVH